MFKPTFKPVAIRLTHSVIATGQHAVTFLVDCTQVCENSQNPSFCVDKELQTMKTNVRP